MRTTNKNPHTEIAALLTCDGVGVEEKARILIQTIKLLDALSPCEPGYTNTITHNMLSVVKEVVSKYYKDSRYPDYTERLRSIFPGDYVI
jgi:hypothetical protein